MIQGLLNRASAKIPERQPCGCFRHIESWEEYQEHIVENHRPLWAGEIAAGVAR